MQQNRLVRINFPAGIISPGHLFEVLEIAAAARVTQVRFGARQQLLIEVPLKQYKEFTVRCQEKKIAFFTKGEHGENIVSSYAAAGIFISDSWLSEGVYKDVFDLFDFLPQLKVNINDSSQTFVPLFTGNINWIASPHAHFWYLYLRLPKSNTLFRWPHLVYTNNICALSKQLEKLILEEGVTEHSILVSRSRSQLPCITKPIERELVLPRFHLPYYEGFNAYGDQYWLGIYRRNEAFSIPFLKDLCSICLQTKVSELYATTWKTIIIKGIGKAQRKLWDYILGKHRINVRHAANELNWLIEDNCEDGLILKRHIIRYFDKEDVRTYGLCFSVKTKTRSGIFGSVVIRREELINPNRLKSLERYTIYYTADFNPNSSELILFREKVEKEYLGTYLVSLCKQFYENETEQPQLTQLQSKHASTKRQEDVKMVYQCSHCQSVYDEEIGDPDRGVAAGVSFQDLPKEYTCSLCDAPKKEFSPVPKKGLFLQSA